jgi:hypothetical protein
MSQGLLIDCWHSVVITTLVYYLLSFRIGRISKFKRKSFSKFAISASALIFRFSLRNEIAIDQASIQYIISKWAPNTSFLGPINGHILTKLIYNINAIYITVITVNNERNLKSFMSLISKNRAYNINVN